jgi:hypothetical protein
MSFSRKRAVALLTAAAALFALVVAAPASAAAPQCHLLLSGPTPSVEVDTNDDGVPEVRVPSVTNVTLCVGADVVLTRTPSIETVPCGEFASCMAFYVDYGLSGYAEAGVKFCYTVDGTETCGQTVPVRVPLNFLRPGRICVGYDLGGGFPCSGGQAVSFD